MHVGTPRYATYCIFATMLSMQPKLLPQPPLGYAPRGSLSPWQYVQKKATALGMDGRVGQCPLPRQPMVVAGGPKPGEARSDWAHGHRISTVGPWVVLMGQIPGEKLPRTRQLPPHYVLPPVVHGFWVPLVVPRAPAFSLLDVVASCPHLGAAAGTLRLIALGPAHPLRQRHLSAHDRYAPEGQWWSAL